MKLVFLTTDNREYYKDYQSRTPNFGTAPEALLQGFAQIPDLEVHVISCLRQPVVSPEKLGPNISFHSLHVPKIGWMRTAYQGCVRATRARVRAIRPDLVHGQGTELDCGISAVFSGFPNVLTIHGNMRLIARVNRARMFSFYWFASRLEEITIPRSRGVVCITRYTQHAVSDLARKTWVVPNAVDGAFFQVQCQPTPEQPPQILCVATVSVRKNQVAFIRALDPLAKEKSFEVLFVGLAWPEKAYDSEFLALVRERPWCRHVGISSREEIRAFMSKASLLVLPSLEDNCPMVVLEAMAAGLPVIAANVGGVPDLVEDKKTGLFCDPLDAASMRNAVAWALSHNTETAAMAKEARRQALERFHPRVVARRHVEIYQEVLAKRGSTSSPMAV